jgi:hypothetical protein
MSVVYWAYDGTCDHPADSGYIGVTENRRMRRDQLRRDYVRFPPDVKMMILFEGTREECLDLERRLRPHANMGWNRNAGGVAPVRLKHGRAPIGPEIFKDFWPEDDERYDRPGLVGPVGLPDFAFMPLAATGPTGPAMA